MMVENYDDPLSNVQQRDKKIKILVERVQHIDKAQLRQQLQKLKINDVLEVERRG